MTVKTNMAVIINKLLGLFSIRRAFSLYNVLIFILHIVQSNLHILHPVNGVSGGHSYTQTQQTANQVLCC